MKMRTILIFVSSYNTHQRNELIGFFEKNKDRSFTSEEAASSLSHIPQSTLYRLLGKLKEEGVITENGREGRCVLYRYQGTECPEHMHIRCKECGRTEHLDEETTREIEKLVASDSGFQALNSTIFEGICSECRRKGK